MQLMEGLWWSCDCRVVFFLSFMNSIYNFAILFVFFFFTGILEVQAKIKTNFVYYT